MTEILGFAAALVIGISLGLIGGGGSILTVPVLVYLLGFSPVISTAYSLFIVGLTALIGSFSYMKKKLIAWKTGVIFAIPSFTAVFLTRKFIVPAIPDILFTFGDFELTKDIFLMALFAVIMLLASYSMIKKKKTTTEEAPKEKKLNFALVAVEGFVVGTLTGLVGAGGGFLIIPALVVLAGLEMKTAVGTSLLIIAAKSLIGFLGDVSEQEIDWQFLFTFSGFSIVGVFVGSYLTNFISGSKLKTGFGWFVLLMGIWILAKEFLLS
jgi:uncharacterized membrane protein YfcA